MVGVFIWLRRLVRGEERRGCVFSGALFLSKYFWGSFFSLRNTAQIRNMHVSVSLPHQNYRKVGNMFCGLSVGLRISIARPMFWSSFFPQILGFLPLLFKMDSDSELFCFCICASSKLRVTPYMFCVVSVLRYRSLTLVFWGSFFS